MVWLGWLDWSFRKDRRSWSVVWWLVLVVVLDTLLGVGSPLAPGPRLRRFTHAGSSEAALEAIEKVSALLRFLFLCVFFPFCVFKNYSAIQITKFLNKFELCHFWNICTCMRHDIYPVFLSSVSKCRTIEVDVVRWSIIARCCSIRWTSRAIQRDALIVKWNRVIIQ